MSGTKYDTGKPRPELLSPDALLAISQVLAFGAQKYDAHNWRKGFDWSRLIGASFRHLLAFQNGEDKDPESGLSHLAHLGCCVMFLLEHESRKLGTDDRYKHTPPVKQFQNPPLADDDEPTLIFTQYDHPPTKQEIEEQHVKMREAYRRLENDPAVDMWRHSGMGVHFIK